MLDVIVSFIITVFFSHISLVWKSIQFSWLPIKFYLQIFKCSQRHFPFINSSPFIGFSSWKRIFSDIFRLSNRLWHNGFTALLLVNWFCFFLIFTTPFQGICLLIKIWALYHLFFFETFTNQWSKYKVPYSSIILPLMSCNCYYPLINLSQNYETLFWL